MEKRNLLLMLMFFVQLSFVPCSLAEAEDEKKNYEKTYELESMTVTSSSVGEEKSSAASKMEKKVQDIPMSIKVFSGQEIEDAKIDSIPTLTRFTPNVLMKEMPIFHYPVIRGMSTFHTSVGTNAGIIADEVFYPASYMQNIDLMDLEQIEILKGPQGTLYGRNTQSGLIVITSRQPGTQFRGKVISEYGSNNSVKGGLALSGPVVEDTLYLGGLFQYKASDGEYENLGSGPENPADLEHLNGRGILRWTPSDPWDVTLSMDVMDTDDHAGALRKISGSLATPAHTVDKDSEEYLRQNSNSQSLKVKYKAGPYDITSVTTALNQDLEKVTDNDFTSIASKQMETTLELDAKAYSQEFRISKSDQGPFEWVVGISMFDESIYRGAWKQSVSTQTITSSSGTDTDSTGYALFGEQTYTLYDRLHLTAGLRLEHLELEGHARDFLNNESLAENKDYDEALPKAAIAYDLSQKAMAYASVSRGYKAGGFNRKYDESIFTYEAEYLMNYETGVKTTWFEDRLLANISLFYMDLSDKQVSEYDEDTGESIITNTGEATSKGVELELRYKPVSGWELFAGMGYNIAKIDSFFATESTSSGYIETDYSGNYLPYAPRVTYNLGMQYWFAKGFFARADILGADKFYGDIANTLEQEAYYTANLRLGYEFKSFDLTLSLENIFNKEYLTYMNGSASNAIGTDGPGRTITLGVTYRF